MHGAGVIQAIEEKVIQHEKRQYYVMHIEMGDIKVLIPINNAEDIGVRSIIDRDYTNRVYDVFKQPIVDFNNNWNKRYRENLIKIKSGDILELATVLKSLMIRDKTKRLSAGEKKMLTNAKHILVSELVLADSCKQEESVNDTLNEIVDNELNNILGENL